MKHNVLFYWGFLSHARRLRRRAKIIFVKFFRLKIALLFALFSYCFSGQTAITSIEKMTLINGQEVILLTDSSKGENVQNEEQANIVVQAAKNLAEFRPNISIDFGYQDLGVYDVLEIKVTHQYKDRQNQTTIFETNEGTTLVKEMQQTKFPLFAPATHFLLLLPRVPGISKFDRMVLNKPTNNMAISSGYLTAAFSQIIDDDWPENLNIHSNDPRHSYLYELTNSNDFNLAQSREAFSIRSLLILSPIFKRKIMMFQENASLFPQFVNDNNKPDEFGPHALKNMFDQLKKAEQQHLKDFATLVWRSLKIPVDPSMFTMTINEFENAIREQHKTIFGGEKKYSPLKDGFSIQLIQGAWVLRENLQYEISPILDVLLTIYSINAPKVSIVVLQEELAPKLSAIIKNFGSVEKNQFLSTENLFEAIAAY